MNILVYDLHVSIHVQSDVYIGTCFTVDVVNMLT